MIGEYYFFRGRYALGHFLASLQLPKDSEVAIQAYTCVAVVEGVRLSGLHPTYIDILPNDVVIDPEDLLRKLSARTRVVVVQHTFGRVGDMARIVQICRERNLVLIEDCCHTWSSHFGSTSVGGFGAASFYSFEWGKPVIAGIGGLLRLNDESLRPALEKHFQTEVSDPPLNRRVQIELQYFAFRLFFRPRFYWKLRKVYHLLSRGRVITPSYNSIEESSAESHWSMSRWAKARVKNLKEKLKRHEGHSSLITDIYDRHLKGFDIPVQTPGVVAHRFPLFIKNKEVLLNLAAKSQVEVAGWYDSPVHPLSGDALKKVGYIEGSCPNAERASATLISLPTHLNISTLSAERIATFVKRYANTDS